jgi:hypothetical protein
MRKEDAQRMGEGRVSSWGASWLGRQGDRGLTSGGHVLADHLELEIFHPGLACVFYQDAEGNSEHRNHCLVR